MISAKPTNKYKRFIRRILWTPEKPASGFIDVEVDVYDVLRAFEQHDPCIQHAIKKMLATGKRGHKDREQDIRDVIQSMERALEMHLEFNSSEVSK